MIFSLYNYKCLLCCAVLSLCVTSGRYPVFAQVDLAKKVIPSRDPLDELSAEDRKAIDLALEKSLKAEEKRKEAHFKEILQGLSSQELLKLFDTMNSLRELRLPAVRGVPLFRDLLKHQHPHVRATAAQALGEYKGQAQTAVPDLIALIGKEDEKEKENYVNALIDIAPKDPQVLKAFIGILESSELDNNLISSTAEAVGKMGSGANSAVPELIRLLKSSDQRVQSMAYLALGKITSQKTQMSLLQATDIIRKNNTEALQQDMPGDSAAALQVIKEAGLTASILVPRLVEILKTQPRTYLRVGIFDALAAIGPGTNEEAVTLLLGAIEEKESTILVDAARKAIYNIQPGDEEAVPALIKGLNSVVPDVRLLSASSIAELGPTAKAATADLVKLMQEEANKSNISPMHLSAYANALYNIGSRASGAYNPLLALLNNNSPIWQTPLKARYFQPYIYAILAKIGLPLDEAKRRETLERVGVGLKNNDPYIYASAARLAGAFGAEAHALVPLLLRPLEASDMSDAIMTPLFESSMMPMPITTAAHRSILEESHGHHKEGLTTATLEAIRALAKIGIAAAPAIPTLKKYAESDDESPLSFYREDAKKAIIAITAAAR